MKVFHEQRNISCQLQKGSDVIIHIKIKKEGIDVSRKAGFKDFFFSKIERFLLQRQSVTYFQLSKSVKSNGN